MLIMVSNKRTTNADHRGTKNDDSEGEEMLGTGVYVTEVGPCDVLLGRGTGPSMHEGNIRFRQAVEDLKPAYVSTASRKAKKSLVQKTVHAIKAKKGRFLNKLDKCKIKMLGLGEKVAYEVVRDSVAVEKTKQAIRYVHYKKEPAAAKVELKRSSSGATEASKTSLAEPSEMGQLLGTALTSSGNGPLSGSSSSFYEDARAQFLQRIARESSDNYTVNSRQSLAPANIQELMNQIQPGNSSKACRSPKQDTQGLTQGKLSTVGDIFPTPMNPVLDRLRLNHHLSSLLYASDGANDISSMLAPSAGWELTQKQLVAKRFGMMPSIPQGVAMKGNDGVNKNGNSLDATLAAAAQGSRTAPATSTSRMQKLLPVLPGTTGVADQHVMEPITAGEATNGRSQINGDSNIAGMDVAGNQGRPLSSYTSLLHKRQLQQRYQDYPARGHSPQELQALLLAEENRRRIILSQYFSSISQRR